MDYSTKNITMTLMSGQEQGSSNNSTIKSGLQWCAGPHNFAQDNCFLGAIVVRKKRAFVFGSDTLVFRQIRH